MQRKVSKKEPLRQAKTETPEQKEIRLLKKRLERTKIDSNLYEEWWLESCKKHDETKIKLNAAWVIVEVNSKTESIYKRMYERSEQEAAEWKEKYERLKAKEPNQPSTSFLSDAAAERIFRCYNDIMSGVNGLVEKNKREIENAIEKGYTKSSPKKGVIQLICIRVDDKGKLDEYSRYTSPGIEKGGLSGIQYYPINELNGEIFPCDHFHVSTAKRKPGRPRKSNS